MSIVVDGSTYTVPESGKQFRIPLLGDTTHPYRRHKPGGVLESDEAMQVRVQADVVARRVRSSRIALAHIRPGPRSHHTTNRCG